MAILEAWAYGLPVLMTDHCHLPNGFARDAAIRVEPLPFSIAEGMHRFLALSPDERRAMGLRGRELVAQSYSWETVAGQFLAVYDWILGGPKPRIRAMMSPNWRATAIFLGALLLAAISIGGGDSEEMARRVAWISGPGLCGAFVWEAIRCPPREWFRVDWAALAAAFYLTLAEFLFPQPQFSSRSRSGLRGLGAPPRPCGIGGPGHRPAPDLATENCASLGQSEPPGIDGTAHRMLRPRPPAHVPQRWVQPGNAPPGTVWPPVQSALGPGASSGIPVRSSRNFSFSIT